VVAPDAGDPAGKPGGGPGKNQEPRTTNQERVMKRTKKSNFTLIELLAAIGVFAIIMLIVFQMLASSQKVWSLSETNTRIYENARIALDIITRDLQCAIASNRSGGEIPFSTGNWAASSGSDKIAFVSAVDASSSAQSKLCEIIYHHDTTNNELKRSLVDDGDGADWNFYGETTGTDWFDDTSVDDTNRQTVIRGVDDLQFVCQNASGATMAAGTYTELPASVYVSITLFDPKLDSNAPDAVRDKTKRTFTKMIYLKTGALGN
jgi:Tfp pilus assembly protein PilW